MRIKNVSPAQLRVRQAFALSVAFLMPLQSVIKRGYAIKARRLRSLPLALAMKQVLQNAVVKNEEQLRIDPAKVLLCDGSLMGVNIVNVRREPEWVKVDFSSLRIGNVADDDLINLCLYQMDKELALLNSTPVRRVENTIQVDIPEHMKTDTFEVYLLVSDRSEHNFSRSKYLGCY